MMVRQDVRAALSGLVFLAALATAGCRPPAEGPSPARETTPAPATAGPPLATVAAIDPAVRIDVIGVRRLGRDIVEIQLEMANPDPAREVHVGHQFAETEAEAGTFSAAFLLTEAGTARYFVLRDAEGRPASSHLAEAIPPRGRRPGWIRFASPGGAGGRITLQLKGLPPLTGLPLEPAP